MLLVAFCLLVSNLAEAMQIDDVLKAFVKENYPWAEVDISEVMLSSEPSAGQPERVLVQKGLPNKTVFVLEYKDGKRITVTAYVKAYDWAVMTRRTLKKGYVLQKEDVYTTLMEVSRIPKDAVRVSDQLVGTMLSRSVTANAPLVAGMVQEAQQVKRGQPLAALDPNLSANEKLGRQTALLRAQKPEVREAIRLEIRQGLQKYGTNLAMPAVLASGIKKSV